MGSEFRDKIKGYADKFWFIPCKDNLVWACCMNRPINVQEEIKKRKLSDGEWKGRFLYYGSPEAGMEEGLFLVKGANATNPKCFEASKFPDRIMLCSWSDKRESLPERPPYWGLNDCAHFVSECLGAADIKVPTPSAPVLLSLLRGLGETKTLGLTISKDNAERIIDSGIMKFGDVLIFSHDRQTHNHCTVYLGNGKIAMHTHSNHPDDPQWSGLWNLSANRNHPLVTLIHFGQDDSLTTAASWLPGWWKVTRQGITRHYYFDKNGRVGYSKQQPANSQRPILAPEGKGYWFDSISKIKICWTTTGDLEEFSADGGKAGNMRGTWNDSPGVVAEKLQRNAR